MAKKLSIKIIECDDRLGGRAFYWWLNYRGIPVNTRSMAIEHARDFIEENNLDATISVGGR